MPIQLKQDKQDRWYYAVIANNGEILVHSEVYDTKSNARRGVRDLVNAIVDYTEPLEDYDSEENPTNDEESSVE